MPVFARPESQRFIYSSGDEAKLVKDNSCLSLRSILLLLGKIRHIKSIIMILMLIYMMTQRI